MSIIEQLSEAVEQGQASNVKELSLKAIQEGMPAKQVLEEGLLLGMNSIGIKFRDNEVYIPDVLIAARAMKAGVDIIKPYLVQAGVKAEGTVILGTVRGDLHDIGKNLVRMMFEGKGINVIDLGVDVPAEVFIEQAKEHNADMICCSALLTTTMEEMKNVVKKAEESGIRKKVKIMVGGSPISQDFCDSIGADLYSPDAASAADMALSALSVVKI